MRGTERARRRWRWHQAVRSSKARVTPRNAIVYGKGTPRNGRAQRCDGHRQLREAGIDRAQCADRTRVLWRVPDVTAAYPHAFGKRKSARVSVGPHLLWGYAKAVHLSTASRYSSRAVQPAMLQGEAAIRVLVRSEVEQPGVGAVRCNLKQRVVATVVTKTKIVSRAVKIAGNRQHGIDGPMVERTHSPHESVQRCECAVRSELEYHSILPDSILPASRAIEIPGLVAR